jgi:hypothetical protein
MPKEEYTWRPLAGRRLEDAFVSEDPPFRVWSIPQVFMNPEVRAAIEEGEIANLAATNVPCGILVTFKKIEAEQD